VSPKGRVLGAYGGFAATAGFVVAIAARWPWKLLAVLPIAASVMLAVASWRAGRAVVRSWTEGEDLTAASDASSSVTAKDPFLGDLARLTAVFAGIAVVLMSAIASFDYYDSHKRPHEHATVVAEERVPSASCTGGHALRAQYSVTWRSDDPPPGLPAVFTQDDSCKFYPAGHSDTIVRRPRIDGVVRVEVSPFDSVLDELVLVVGGTLLSVPIGALWALWRISKRSKTPT
jgi:hypothetical protein